MYGQTDIWQIIIRITFNFNLKKTVAMKKYERLIDYVHDTIYPTPPLGQDMTQGQFSRGV